MMNGKDALKFLNRQRGTRPLDQGKVLVWPIRSFRRNDDAWRNRPKDNRSPSEPGATE